MKTVCKLIIICTLLFSLYDISYSQQGENIKTSKITADFLLSSQVNGVTDVIGVTLTLAEGVFNGIEGFKLFYEGGQREIGTLPGDVYQYANVIGLYGTGGDFSMRDLNAGNLVVKTVLAGNLGWVFQKLVFVTTQMTIDWFHLGLIISSQEKISQYFNSTGYVSGKKFKINFRFTRARGRILNNAPIGDFIQFDDITVYPEDYNAYAYDWMEYFYEEPLVHWVIKFEDLSSGEIIQGYRHFTERWSQLINNKSLIHKMLFDVDPNFFTTQIKPHIEMYVTGKIGMLLSPWSALADDDIIGEFKFELGSSTIFPVKPYLTLQEKDYSLILDWPDDPNATIFKLLRKEQPDIDTSETNIISIVTSSEYEDVNVVPGKRYYYRVIPVMDDAITGPISNEVSGIARAEYLVDFTAGMQTEYFKGSQFILSGNVKSIIDNSPIDSATVVFYLDNLNYEFGSVQTLSDGYFEDTVEVPVVPGNYSFSVTAVKNGITQSKPIPIRSKENPNKGRDLSVDEIIIGDLLKQPDEAVSTSIKIKNLGNFTETDSIKLALFDKDNSLINFVHIPFSLNASDSIILAKNFVLPASLSDDDYYLKATVENNLDINRLNNFNRITFTVSTIPDPPAYRLSESEFDYVGQTKMVDNYQVKLLSASNLPPYAEFKVNGDNTPLMEEDDIWVSNTEDYMLILNIVDYTNDTTLSIIVRSGRVHNGISFSPYHIGAKKLSNESMNVIGPTGSHLQTNIQFIKDDDASILYLWSDDPIVIANNNLEIPFSIPDADSRVYYSYLKIIDSGLNYWWVKRLYVSAIRGHEIKKSGILDTLNITAGTEPGDIIGDRYLIEGVFENIGEFNELVPIRIEVTDDSLNSKWVMNKEIQINTSDTTHFKFPFPTLGLSPGDYHINVTASEPEDHDTSDNYLDLTLAIDTTKPLVCSFDLINTNYDRGDSVNIKINIEYENTPVTNADAVLSIYTPLGDTLTNELIFDSFSSQYKSSFIANTGGNYYLNVEALARRFSTGTADTIVKAKVDLYIDRFVGVADLGEIQNLLLTTSNVGDLYSFACDFVYGNKFYFMDIAEGSLINNNETFETSFNYSNTGERLIVGITKYDPSSLPSNAFQKSAILSTNLFVKEDGQHILYLENVGLFDRKGTAMYVADHLMEVNLKADTSLFKMTFLDSSYNVGDTLSVSSSALGITNLKSVSFDILYDTSKVEYLLTEFDSSLSNYGEVNFIADAVNNPQGNVTLGISRTGAEVWGITSPVIKFATTKFVVTDSGYTNFFPNNIHLISPFSSVEYPFKTYLDTLKSFPINQSINSEFNPNTIFALIDSTISSDLINNGCSNIFSITGHIYYSPEEIKIMDLVEGNLLNADGISTVFNYNVDSTMGRIDFGITRLGIQNGGITSDTTKSIFSIEMYKKSGNFSQLTVNDIVFTDHLGNVYRPLSNANLYILTPGLKLNSKVYLQGCYSDGVMGTSLEAQGLIPTNQPFNASPWNYSGNENLISFPTIVVDWVLIELRSNLTTMVSRRAGFLKSDGSIVDLDGVNLLNFPGVNNGDYYVVIYQRNHLAIMTANPIALSETSTLYDFTTAQTQAYGTNAMKELGGGAYGMYSGDASKDGQIDADDRAATWNERNLVGYKDEDVSMDGQVDADDRATTWNNRNIVSQVPAAVTAMSRKINNQNNFNK